MARIRTAQLAFRCAWQSTRPRSCYLHPFTVSLGTATLSENPATVAARRFSIANSRRERDVPAPEKTLSEPRQWDFETVKKIAESRPKSLLLIDVREPSELQATGTIPGSLNVPITSHPNAFHLPAEHFHHLFGFEKPETTGPDAPELVFFCKAGVRGRAAAQLAKNAGYGRIGDYPGSWLDWSAKGGKVEQFQGDGAIWQGQGE